ncbi:hypothetical protein AFLA_005326 [Aspergillus flavus NRRL3357]|nr:hypothetical protein AFLA_005326 [Aspergillus flavus NRRL3357]
MTGRRFECDRLSASTSGRLVCKSFPRQLIGYEASRLNATSTFDGLSSITEDILLDIIGSSLGRDGEMSHQEKKYYEEGSTHRDGEAQLGIWEGVVRRNVDLQSIIRAYE